MPLKPTRNWVGPVGSSCSHADAHLRRVSGGIFGATSPSPNTGAGYCFSVPSIKAEDAVGFGNGVPALDVVQGSAACFTRPDIFRIEFCLQLPDLSISKRHHFVLITRMGFAFPRQAPGTSLPRFRSEASPWRSSFGGCGTHHRYGLADHF